LIHVLIVASAPGDLPYTPMSVLSVLEDSCGVNLIIVDVIFFALAVVAVGLRLWARRIMKTRLCLNDYAIILALVLRAFPAWGRQREITDLRKLLTTALVTTALFGMSSEVLIALFELAEWTHSRYYWRRRAAYRICFPAATYQTIQGQFQLS